MKLTWTKYFHKKIVKGETLYHFFHLYIIFFISPFIDASILTFYSKGQGYIYYYLYYRCRQWYSIVGGTGGLIYIDPATMRRTNTVTTATVHHHQENQVTMTTTASQLARAFSVVVRQVADLLTMIQDYNALAPGLPRVLEISDQEASDLQVICMSNLQCHGLLIFTDTFL